VHHFCVVAILIVSMRPWRLDKRCLRAGIVNTVYNDRTP
jgi:hypothetical protein